MLTLTTRHAEFRNFERVKPSFFRLSSDPTRPKPLRSQELYLGDPASMPEDFLGAVVVGDKDPADHIASPMLLLPDTFSYLADGDIIRVEAHSGRVRVLFRENANQNSFLLTERCNHFCLMCSQPPKDIDDSWIVDETLQVLRMLPISTREIGFTGGEPTLLGDRFIDLLRIAKSYLPTTAVHVLSNGRAFVSRDYCAKVAAVGHEDLMFGIPVYADISNVHDYIVQADGAFDETIRGIINLKKFGQQIELRVVLHKQSILRLRRLAEFITRNLTFVDHVALMGLEVTGFTKANLPELWIDPYDYRTELAEAALDLEAAGMNVSIFNLQHCLLEQRIWHLSRQSISDWKNDYVEECQNCSMLSECGGFFSTGMSRVSDYIKAIGPDILQPAGPRRSTAAQR